MCIKMGLLSNAVLVAHNGYNFDYPILLAEMERHEINPKCFERNNIHFSDTLYSLRQVK